MRDSEELIILSLRQAVAEQRRRLQEIEDSSAWRAGGVVRELLVSPLRRGPTAFWGLLSALRRRRQSQSAGRGQLAGLGSPVAAEADSARVLIFGSAVPAAAKWGSSWQTCDAQVLLSCLEKRGDGGVLVLRRLNPAVMRPLARLQRLGWKLVWMPESGAAVDYPHLARHVCQLADEVMDDSPA